MDPGLVGDAGRMPGHHPSHHQVLGGGAVTAHLYQDLPPESHSGPVAAGLFSSTLASKLGISLPNPAPEVDMAPPPPPTIQAGTRGLVGPSMPPGMEAGASQEPRKKKYAKEAWPGKKLLPGLLV